MNWMIIYLGQLNVIFGDWY